MEYSAAAEFASALREQLAAQADVSRASAMAAYMKHRFSFFGIQTPARRALTRPAFATLGKMPDADGLLSVAESLWAFDERECQYVAVDLLVKYADRFDARHEPRIASLLRAKAWWDSVDLLAAHVYGALCRKDAGLAARMRAYAVHEDMWLRRVAILHQLNDGAETDRPRLAAILSANLGQTEFFICKAMGWALRQFARHDPDWVRGWIAAQDAGLSALTRREALKHL